MKNIYEIFDELENAKTKKDRINILRNNKSYALECVLRGMFHPKIKYLVEKIPSYRPSDSPEGMGYSSISQELDRIYLLEEGNPRAPAALTQTRREQILTQMLESLEAREAEVFAAMIKKKSPIKTLNRELAVEAFPDLLA